jgi:hypothetical protein
VKAKRIYMKKLGWKDVDWYTNWPSIASEWNEAARGLLGKAPDL